MQAFMMLTHYLRDVCLQVVEDPPGAVKEETSMQAKRRRRMVCTSGKADSHRRLLPLAQQVLNRLVHPGRQLRRPTSSNIRQTRQFEAR